MKPRLIIEQKITAFVNRYVVYDIGNDGTKNTLRAFVEQKRLAFKEKVSFYSDASKHTVAFTFRAEKVMDVHGKYFVEDGKGEMIGMFKKRFGRSLINSTWDILDTDENIILTISESNQFLAVTRRYVGWIPFVGDLFAIITNFIKYHFSFRNPSGVEVATYTKTTLFRDHYQFDATDEVYDTVDWRVLAAMSVALDALQSR